MEVQDSGIGISPDNQKQLFRHGFTTRKEGHGFGLHSSAVYVKEMGGETGLESPGLGLGAIFWMELPIDKLAMEQEAVAEQTQEHLTGELVDGSEVQHAK